MTDNIDKPALGTTDEQNNDTSLNPNDSAAEPQPKSIDVVVAVQEYRSNKSNILNLYIGDTIYVLAKQDSGWWDGVIVSNNGTLRGWFPSSYTKTANEQQITPPPSQQQQQQRSVRQPQQQTFASVLRQNLNDSGSKSRKSSTVSFASSEHSLKSSSDYGIDPTSKQTVAFSSTHDKINIVSSQEAEAMINSSGSSNSPIWIPQTTSDGKLLYYNAELNIYCKELPYVETPEVDENSQFQIPPKDQNRSNISSINANQLSSQDLKSSRTHSATTGGYEKGSSVRSRSSLPSSGTVHPWNTSLYCVPNLFYYDPTDIKTWSGLRDAFIYFLQLSLDALQKKVAPLFHTYYNVASRLGTLIHLSARLAQHDLRKSGYQNRVQKRLKRIASSIAKVGINGDLYLTELEPLSSTHSGTGSASGNTTATQSYKQNGRNYSSSTQETLKPHAETEESISDPSTRVGSESGVPGYFQQIQEEIEILKKSAISVTKIFIQIASNQFNDRNYLPQVYPRFLTGFFSGGNWRNPFLPEPKDPFVNKDVPVSLNSRKVPKVILNKESVNSFNSKKEQLEKTLEGVLDLLNEQPNTEKRNAEISSKVYKSLSLSTKFIDLMEGLDFSIFTNPRRNSTAMEFDVTTIVYPILTELFEAKQAVRDIFISIIMDCQGLTLQDPTVFKSIREDALPTANKFANVEPEKTAELLRVELQKLDVEDDEGIAIDVDKNMHDSIRRSFKLLEVTCLLIQQLASERDALLNYATRIMNEDFLFELVTPEREDSTMTNDEYALPSGTLDRNAKKDEPWFLDSEEYNLIFTANDAVKGGTKEALIQRLTHHQLLDAQFNMVFLLTFKSMFKTTELVQLLVKRFNIQPPENLTYDEYRIWVEKKSYPIKLRVVNIMKSLLQKYWVPTYNEPSLYKIWKSFVDLLVQQKFPGCDQLSRELDAKVLNAASAGSEFDREVPLSAPQKTKKFKLLDIDPDEFSNQLTIREFDLYSKISQIECLDKSWNNKYGSLGGYPHIQAFIANSNDLTNFVSTQIVNQNDLKKRINIIKYFIDVAEKCRQLNNFSSMTAIISALYSSPTHRLKITWRSVSESSMNLLNKMNDFMNSSRNFSEYREHMRIIQEKACVPFLGVYLSDLTFISNGNSDHLHGDIKLINFAKRAKTVDVLQEISRYKSTQYNLKKNDDIQEFLSYHLNSVLTIDEQYNKSLIIEPRIRITEALKNTSTKPASRSAKLFQHFMTSNGDPRFAIS